MATAAADDLLDLAAVAGELKVSHEKARQLCVTGKLPYVDLGGGNARSLYRVRWGDLLDFKRATVRGTNDVAYATARANDRYRPSGRPSMRERLARRAASPSRGR